MEMRERQDRAKRLLAYSAAASLGAFSFGQAAEASIRHVDVNPDAVLDTPGTGPGYEIYLNIDRIGSDPEIKIQLVDFGSAYASVRGRNIDYNVALTNTAKGNSYYIRSFNYGDIIGFGNPNMAIESGPGNILKPADGDLTAAGFGRDVPSYMGFALHENGSTDYYFGWIRVQVDWDAVQGIPVGVTVMEYAVETEPNVDIPAGAIPEPATLGLLAAGLGGLAVRRRKA